MNNCYYSKIIHWSSLFIIVFFSFQYFAQDNAVSLWRNEPFGSFSANAELTELRDENSKHFRNGPGTSVAYVAAGKVHYWEDGKWKTIFHTIEPVAGGFQNIHNSHKTFYPLTSTGSIVTQLEDGNRIKDMIGMQMYFSSNGDKKNVKNIVNKQGNAAKNVLTYSGVYGQGIDLRLTQNTTNRKMDYIIQSKNALGSIPANTNHLVFEETVELPVGWTAVIEGDRIILRDASFAVKASYEKPVIQETLKHEHHDESEHDHVDHHSDSEIIGSYQISQVGQYLTIKTLVPISWLLENERNFPVIVDPTINCYPNSSARWTGSHQINNNPVNYDGTSINASSDGDFYMGRNDTYYIHNGWVKYNVSSIPTTACINSAVFRYNVIANNTYESSCSVQTRFRHINSDPSVNDFTNATNNQNRLADIRDGVIYGQYNTSISAAGNGWQSWDLTANMSYLSSQLPQGWFAIGVNTYGGNASHTTCRNTVAGHSHALKPYLTVQYSMPSPSITGNNILCVGQTSQLTAGASGITGGTITYANGFKIHTFSTVGTHTLNVPAGVSQNMEVLVVAGGGGGGWRHAGGGGAGGLISTFHTVNGSQTVVVGAGGNGSVSGGAATNGENSSFGVLTALGGGYGSSNGGPANVGGSGGGGSNNIQGKLGTAGQGNKGGNQGCAPSSNVSSCSSGGACTECNGFGSGGGGAGASGGDVTGGNGSAGGIGVLNSFSGSDVWYAGGGGGGRSNATASYLGGTGGGGAGGNSSSMNGSNGTANTGGGGGGGGANGTNSGNGGNGGSGIVIIRYPDPVSTWQSGNPSVATVSSTGLVTAVGVGTASIYNISQGYCSDAVTTITVTNNETAGVLMKKDPTTCSPQNGTISAFIEEENFKGTSVWYRNSFNTASPEIGSSSLSGNAVLNNNTMRFTEALNSQFGTLTVANPSGINASSVVSTFDLFIGSGNGADGMEFSYGQLKVRFDSYNNGSGTVCEGENISGGRVGVGIYQNNTLLSGGCYSNLDIRNKWVNVYFHVDVSGRVYLKVGNVVLFNYIFLTDRAGYSNANKSAWTWVFSGATGGMNDEHRIDNLHIAAFNHYEYNLNGGSWQASNTFSNVGSGTHTVNARPKANGVCTGGVVNTIRNAVPSSVSIAPSPVNACAGANVTLVATVTPPSVGTIYLLMFPSAYGANWHGVQEIRGRNAAGVFQTLTCVGSSSSTYTSDNCNSPDYGAANAFDGTFNSGNANLDQWLTPKEWDITGSVGGYPSTNWRNFGTFDPFVSPEWIAFSSPVVLNELLIYNGRYNSGASSSCFKEYHLLATNDNGASWTKIKEGTLLNIQGVPQTISVTNPNDNNFVWKKAGVTVGTGDSLILTGVTTANAGTYTVETGYEPCNIVSSNVTVNVSNVSAAATSVSGGGTACHGQNVTLTPSGATAGTNPAHVWYKGGCNNAYTYTFNSPTLPSWTGGTTINSLNGVVANLTSVNADPMIDMPSIGSFNPVVYRYVNIRYRVTSGSAGNVEIFFYNTTHNHAVGGETGFGALISDGNWHTLAVNMASDPDYLTGGNILGWRFDWATNSGVTMELDFIQLSEFPMIDEDNTTPALILNYGSTHYPAAGVTTTFATAIVDNCGVSSCASTTVTSPDINGALGNHNDQATCVVNQNGWVHFYHSSGRLLASVNSGGNNLGNVTVTQYDDGAPVSVVACDAPTDMLYRIHAMERHWRITPTNNGAATVRLPFYDSELTTVTTTANANANPNDNLAGRGTIRLSKYSGGTFPSSINVDGNAANNCTGAGGTGGTIVVTQSSNGVSNATAFPQSISPASGYVDFPITGFSEFWLHGASSSPLPVDLASFSGTCSSNGIQLNWVTASETNNAYFVIERSRDLLTWEEIAQVSGMGNSSQMNTYNFNDPSGFGGFYYRLIQIDFNGEEYPKSPIHVSCEVDETIISVYPNPTQSTFTVGIQTKESIEDAEISMFDVTGKLIVQRKMDLISGLNEFYFNQDIQSGHYLIKVSIRDEVKTTKLIISH